MKLKLALPFVCVFVLLSAVPYATGWSNGGYSANPMQPDYGTHDWIAQHALDFLPSNEKQYITANLAVYLYGTELPDLPASQGGIGDTTKHHTYYYSNGTLQDDASAKRAREEYQKALTYLKSGNYTEAAKNAGALTHYIADMAVFGHVMGANTAWGTEVHHSDYENHVNSQTGVYSSSLESYLHFDGALVNVSAYDAALNLAFDTTFGNGSYGCSWMDTNYNWSNPDFEARSSESLNTAVNAVADVLHTLYIESQNSIVPEFPATEMLAVLMLTMMVTAVMFHKKGWNRLLNN
ncbi:MAG: zinc dependent phospholipase C family protein [Candidatus Bathyarchaeia archaeon]|jgi:hypothetical protein